MSGFVVYSSVCIAFQRQYALRAFQYICYMALDPKYVELGKVIMAGIQKGIDQVIEEARKNKRSVVVGDGNGGVKYVYPHLEDEKREKGFLEAVRKQAPNL
jgi:hypothetical protein